MLFGQGLDQHGGLLLLPLQLRHAVTQMLKLQGHRNGGLAAGTIECTRRRFGLPFWVVPSSFLAACRIWGVASMTSPQGTSFSAATQLAANSEHLAGEVRQT